MVAAAAALQGHARVASADQYLEEYIRRHGLDARCAQDLRSLSPVELRQVVDVDLVNARNKSAVVASRCTVVRERERNKQVDAYLQRHPVDATAAQALRDLPTDLQRQVMEKDLSNCRNASAVLLSRIRFVTAVSS